MTKFMDRFHVPFKRSDQFCQVAFSDFPNNQPLLLQGQNLYEPKGPMLESDYDITLACSGRKNVIGDTARNYLNFQLFIYFYYMLKCITQCIKKIRYVRSKQGIISSCLFRASKR